MTRDYSASRLIVVLGDQLDLAATREAATDPRRDLVWMAEAAEESTHVWSHKARIGLFLAAMRHFGNRLEAEGYRVRYHRLEENPHRSLAATLRADLAALKPARVVLTEPGDFRVREDLLRACDETGIAPEIRPDSRFLCSPDEFGDWAAGRKTLTLEHFYRRMRRHHGVLMDGESPAGGHWNFDAENRRGFGRAGPADVPAPAGFTPDAETSEVLQLVATRFADHPGRLDGFSWPVSRGQALAALDDFVRYRLADFGTWQDAMWTGEPWLWHSTLSAAMNLGLLRPREVIARVEAAWDSGAVPIASAEGFIRQVLGWREYVRGIYWQHMPEYLVLNALDAQAPLPAFYWSGETDMACLREVIGQTLDHGYAHHIQRLMVTGLFALLLGVAPHRVHEWYLAVYVDAVEWVELPNTLGMSQYADGGIMASKPYAASGRYIQRMSNYCRGCRYDPGERTGDKACPFTTLYWDFLMRHRDRFADQPRTANQWRHLERMDAREKRRIRQAAQRLAQRLA